MYRKAQLSHKRYFENVNKNTRFADPGGVEPDPNLEKILDPDATLENYPNSDPGLYCKM